MDDEQLAAKKDRGWKWMAEIEAAYVAGEIDDEAWHRAMASVVVPAYLGAKDERGGSGHTGTADDWDWSRGVVGEAIDRGGSFLDIGCANGLLMASVVRWAAARGFAIEPFGLEISAELAAEAQRRYPQNADRIFVGNALGWKPPHRFDLVRTGLEYVPRPRRPELVAWLLDEVVAPGGRLLVGKYNEEVDHRANEDDLRAWGFTIAAHIDRPHRTEPRLAYRVVCIDAAR